MTITKKLATLALLSQLFVQPGMASSEDRIGWSSNDYWEETQLEFNSLIYGIFNDQNCKSSAQKLIACVAVLNQIHGLSSPESEELIGLDFENGLSFKKMPKEISLKAYLLDLNKEINDKIDSDALKLTRGSFEEELEQFNANYITASNDSRTAAQLYNTYLTIAVDPHSYIMPMHQMEDSSQATTKSKGIGIFMEFQDHNGKERILITDVVENSPAENAGLKPGDVFLSINNKHNKEEIYKELKETEVLNSVISRGKSVLNIKITKGYYKIVNVKPQTITRPEGTYGLIKLRSFSDSTSCIQIEKNVDKFLKLKNFQGLILDLRNNGGGLVTQATCILKLFLEPTSKIWMTRGLDRQELVYEHYEMKEFKNKLQGYNNIVLVNGYSASASEAVSMYLKDYEKAYIVGERTFGKGSMQSIMEDHSPELGNNSHSVLKAQTTALYYGPKGVSPQINGVEPDFEVLPKIDQLDETPFMREADQYAFPIPDRAVDMDALITERRKDNIDQITNCLERSRAVESHYNYLTEEQRVIFDHQLEYGIQTLNCANKYAQKTRTIHIPVTTDYPIMTTNEFRRLLFREMIQEDLEMVPPAQIEIEIELPELTKPEITMPELKPEFGIESEEEESEEESKD